MAVRSLDREPDSLEADSRDYVNSFSRGLDVIRAFSRAKPAMTLSEVAHETGMTRAAARRFLLTLVRDGYAETDGKLFRLRPKVLELGFSVLSSMSIWEVAQPVMAEVVRLTQEACSATVLDGQDVVYVARVAAKRVMSVDLTIGSRLPAYCTSMGRVLLAGLDDKALAAYFDALKPEKLTRHTVTSKVRLREIVAETRRQGWAMVDQELELGLRSVAVPIRTRAGTVAAAMNVGSSSARVSADEMRERILPELLPRPSASRWRARFSATVNVPVLYIDGMFSFATHLTLTRWQSFL